VRPVNFAGANITFAKDQPEYLPLPAYLYDADGRGCATTCWELDDDDLRRVLTTRRIWVQQLTFGRPLQPLRVATEISGELPAQAGVAATKENPE